MFFKTEYPVLEFDDHPVADAAMLLIAPGSELFYQLCEQQLQQLCHQDRGGEDPQHDDEDLHGRMSFKQFPHKHTPSRK